MHCESTVGLARKQEKTSVGRVRSEDRGPVLQEKRSGLGRASGTRKVTWNFLLRATGSQGDKYIRFVF